MTARADRAERPGSARRAAGRAEVVPLHPAPAKGSWLDQEQRRQSREGRYRAAQELTGLGWWELDLATGAHQWSDQMFRLVGLTPGTPPPTVEEFVELMHPEDRPGARELHTEGFTTGHRDVFRVVHADGSRPLPPVLDRGPGRPRRRDRHRSSARRST